MLLLERFYPLARWPRRAGCPRGHRQGVRGGCRGRGRGCGC